MINDEPLKLPYLHNVDTVEHHIEESLHDTVTYTDLFPKNFSRVKLLFLTEKTGYFQWYFQSWSRYKMLFILWRDFEVWTYDSDNSTQIKCSRQFYLSLVKLVQIQFLRFWQNVMADFCSGDFAVWEAHASLKLCIEIILLIDWAETELLWIFGVSTCSMSKVILKFSWWNFIRHWAAAVPLLETDTISQGRVCRYIFEIWPVLMACTWKNRVLLAVYWDKISIFDLGQPEHRSARGNDPLCAQHRALISLIWCRAI